MATKNMGYGSLCNTGRLHAPLSLKVNTEVLAAPVLRDKLALNITDGLRAQYDGGPDKNAQFVYDNHSLYFATDPFALDMLCHQEIEREAQGDGRSRQREPAHHRVPALRGIAGDRRGVGGEDDGGAGVARAARLVTFLRVSARQARW